MFLKNNKSTFDFIIIGLGNPDKKYELTRHNAGFMAVDKIAKEYNVEVKKLKFKSLIGEAIIDDKRCLLMKPLTYMNNSGEALKEAMNFYKMPIERVIVIYDDISLDPGLLRIRRKGTHGGHNGIKSIINLTNEENFPRIKIGVGKKPHPDYDLADWVLSNFKKDELIKIDDACKCCLDIISDILKDNIDAAMNKYN